MNEQEKDRYHSHIFSAIAHEIRNPLQGIMASAAALGCRIGDNSAFGPFLEVIKRETSRINELIDDMLELTQSITVDTEPHSIVTILEDSVRQTQEAAANRHTILTLNSGKDVSSLSADGHRLARAFSALLLNAIESKEEGGNVTVHIEQKELHILVTIHDDGVGISEENKGKMFEPFFSTNRSKAGLGLPIADYVIRAHKGFIKIHSEVGKGTEVFVALPVLQ